jgi:hypothetical protein
MKHNFLDISDLKVGMRLFVRTEEEVRDMLEEGIGFAAGWSPEMFQFCEKEIEINEVDIMRMQSNAPIRRAYLEFWNWSLDMFVLPDMTTERKIYTGDIDNSLKSSAIEKMIKLARRDYSTIYSLTRISAHMNIEKDVVDSLLNKWAESKWKIFILFGEKLMIDNEVEIELEEQTLAEILEKLGEFNPCAEYALSDLRFSEILNNRYECSSSFFGGDSKLNGQKVSGLVADYFSPKTADFLAVNLFDRRKFTAHMVISIHPADYLTMSVNHSGWESCHKVGEGCYSNGIIDLMVDDTTIVSYRHGGESYRYNMSGVSFHWNSKNWRELFYLDVEKLSFIGSRQYPGTNDGLSKIIRGMLEELMSNKFGLTEDLWKVRRNAHNGYVARGRNYHDVEEGYDHALVYYGTLNSPSFEVGRNIGCIVCGEDWGSDESSTCNNCRYPDDDDDKMEF